MSYFMPIGRILKGVRGRYALKRHTDNPLTSKRVRKQALGNLGWLNFFMADMQAGIGPYLGIFLLLHGWTSGPIGTVLTIGGVVGVLFSAPAGALIDKTTHKKAYVIVSAIATIVACGAILLSQKFAVVLIVQIAAAIAGSVIVPAITGITLGIVRQKGFNRQNGRNQAYNHAGNVAAAAACGVLGWYFGIPAVFGVAGFFAVASTWAVSRVPDFVIDHDAARGSKDDSEDQGVSGFSVLLKSKPVVILAAALAIFHLGNAAMLPLYGMAAQAEGGQNGAAFVALTIGIAQGMMVPAAIFGMRGAERFGYWLVILISFTMLPIRGVIAYYANKTWGVYPVQILDGLGAGIQTAAVPSLIAKVLKGTGRVNVGQGAVMAAQGLGAGLSPALGGWLAQSLGYSVTFVFMGCISFVSIALWVFYAAELKAKCDKASSEKWFPAEPAAAQG